MAKCLLFKHPKVVVPGIASTPAYGRDSDGLSLAAAYDCIKDDFEGVRQRAGG